MSEIDPYLAHVIERVVRMFQRYSQNIDPADPAFRQFVKHYLKERKITDPKALQYVELYKLVKQSIRKYLRQNLKQQSKTNAKP